MGTVLRKENESEGAEPGTARWVGGSSPKVCNLAAEGRMENERCGLCKVCGVSEKGYDGGVG